jgi:hypothetical protein
MLRIIKPQIIKRFCHHSRETNFSKAIDKLNDIELKCNYTSDKISKIQQNTTDISNTITYIYILNCITLPLMVILR